MIPDFQTIMLPLLHTLADGQLWTMRKLTEQLADHLKLSPEGRQQMLPSGQQTTFSNRVAWAKTHMKAAGLVENPKRGQVCISASGKSLLAENPPHIDIKLLERYPAYLEFRSKGASTSTQGSAIEVDAPIQSTATPLETLEESFEKLRQAVATDLLDRLKSCSPQFFEKAVVDLLLAMGYGGFAGEGSLTPAGADGGIDGVIKEDKLGLDVVCVQAKRYAENTVGRPVVQAFVGSMDYHRAKKGVILTTSRFSSQAHDFVKHIEGKKVVLIGGEELAELMIQHNVGVVTQKTYALVEVSDDYFDQDSF